MKAERVLAGTAAGLVLIALSLLPCPPRLIWNRTASMPVGLYLISHAPALEHGMVVAYRPSASEAAFLEAHRYTGRGWPLVKRVAALEGDEVCRRGSGVYINDRLAARARAFDSAGRRLPVWRGCRHLGPGDVLLLADHPQSVDGRYFGVQDKTRVLGELRAAGRHVRRFATPARGAV
jgi:conjugative transfer signal peptidase TraF